MRSITFNNSDKEQLTLRIYSSATGDGIIESESIVINHDTIGYFEDIVGSSSMEFTLIAEYDSQYRDLYTTSATGIKVELIKGSEVIWLGYLDSEIYEEDFNTKKKYPINFKCGNTKIMKRHDFDLTGNDTVRNILTHCMAKIGLNLSYNSSLRSGAINSGDFIINTSVFYNDTEAMNCWDVIEKILQSLGLRSMVIGNTFHVFDLLSIQARTTIDSASISLGDATLSSSPCYKDVVINLNTASDKEIFDLRIDKFEFPYPASSQIDIKEKQGDGDTEIGFIQQITNKKAFDNITIVSGCSVVRNSPRFSGSDEIYIKADSISMPNPASNNIIWKSKDILINTIESSDWYLNISLDVLLSIRSNPFRGVKEKEDTNPETKWWSNHESDFQNHTNYAYIYADIFLLDDSNNVIAHLDNTSEVMNSRQAVPARWNGGSGSTKGRFRFAYYDNMANNSGFDGWQTNSPTIPPEGTGKSYGSLTKTMKGNGTLAQLPPVKGKISIRIYGGVECKDGNQNYPNSQDYSDLRHLWYKNLSVSMCDSNGHDNYSIEDYEYKGELDNDADSTLTIDNIIGQIVDEDYSCRAGYIDAAGKFLTSFQYGTYSDRLEIVNLNMINDVYKQYRNVFEGNYQPVDLIRSKIFISEISKYFWVSGYEYNVDRNNLRITLNEVI